MMRQGAISPFISVPDTIAELLAIGASVPIATRGKVYVRGPINVDIYEGVLCRVTEEYAGTIIKKELEYDSARGDIPVY